ncbi:ING family Png2 [Schizosaccharomyces cryophilus OY26]|uniref:Chromatin modification-related protein n=1 Tax=Schizosaccharomyces cryophilus (strain OY26 / ATCC MYA-4695 / CBS 11777 / NBRC 106824 / NRRL Y48691) TaxID=653667 RepID=S9VTD3_SCHCR|nr:ING family Png2 [Schizosaccharomyces cryophilus OY26]EPY49384.1 ING family Png2 [Schizosaccharomyces cryophilus OY26]
MGTTGIEVFAALNDFTDAIVSIPESVCSNFTYLKEVDAQSRELKSKVTDEIESILRNERTGSLPLSDRCLQLENHIKEMLPFSDSKICLATEAMGNINQCIDRLDADFEYVELEIPQQLRLGYPDRRALFNHPNSGNQRIEGKRETRRNQPQQQHTDNQQQHQHTSYPGHPNEERSSVLHGDENVDVPHTTYSTPSKRRKATAHQKLSSPSHRTKPNVMNVTERRPGRRGTRQATDDLSAKPDIVEPEELNEGEQLYCYCQQVSYGQMIGCDNENCKREWFHLPCVGLVEPPKGIWYCRECRESMKHEA